MEPRDRERVSRVLEAALARLNAEAHGDQQPPNLIEVTGSTLQSIEYGAPVVILIHPSSSEREAIPDSPATQIEKPNSCGCGHHGAQSHPGFDRFPQSESDSRDASKMCFIEPDRACVGSGACEARGY